MITKLSFVLLALLSTRSWATGRVEFSANVHPSFIKVHGVGKEPTAKVEIKGDKADGTFVFDLATLDTKNTYRNDHMLEALDVKNHPQAKLEIKDLPLKTPQKISPVDNADFTGNLTFHGVTKPVQGKYSINSDGDVVSKFKLKLTDYKIEPPSHLGVSVKDEIDVEVYVDKLKGQM
jgi:polyisoprenoid-binding protein YceI